MKRFLLLVLFLCLLCVPTRAQQVIYSQNFELGDMPLNWLEWNYLEFHDDTWASGAASALAGTNSIDFTHGDLNYAYGAFYYLPAPYDDVNLHFLFKATDYPAAISIEIIDMYNLNGDEIGDIYFSPQGRLQLFIGPTTQQTSASIPTNVTVNIWFHYINRVNGTTTATASWSTNSTEPTSGTQFVSASDGTYHTPVTKILLGPVSADGLHFFYDNFEVTTAGTTNSPIIINGSTSFQGNIVLTLSNVPVTNQVPGSCIWSEHFGGVVVGGDGAGVASLKEDGSSNVIAVGGYKGNVNFGGGIVSGSGNLDIFITKRNSSGAFTFVKNFGNTGADAATSVAIDSANNIIVGGYFTGTINMGSTNLVSAGGSDVFVAKFNSAGTLLWAARFGGSALERCNGVSLDSSGNIFLTGQYGFFGTAIDFGGGPLPLSGGTSAFQYDTFIAKLTSNGAYSWANGYGALGDDVGNCTAVDASGNVFMAGVFHQTVNFGGTNIVSLGGSDTFLAKYNGTTGAHTWSFRGGGTGDDYFNGLAIDSSGNAFVTGSFSGTASFGGTALVTPVNIGMLAAKYTLNGVHTWSAGFAPVSSFGLGAGKSIAVDSAGDAVMVGYVSGSVKFGNQFLGFGSNDLLWSKLSGANGSVIWAFSSGDIQSDYVNAAAIGAGDRILIGGSFSVSATTGCGTMSSSAPGELSGDGFISKLNP
jgi:Beta-propeller repeat.